MLDTFARIAFLKKIHLFYDLEEEDLEDIADSMKEISVGSGEVIFQQDSKSENFYLIYSGNVRIMRTQQNKEYQLAVLVKNDYFGEMGLIARRTRSGTVTATSDTVLLTLDHEEFTRFFKKSPQLRLNLDVAVKSRQLARSLRFKWVRHDEVIYFLARKHKIVLYERLILPVLGVGLPLALFYAWYFISPLFIVLFAAILSLIADALWVAWEVVDWGNDYYIVTNQRVVWLEKVIGLFDSRQESPISTILSVSVETSQLGRILDYGDVIIRTFVGKVTFGHVTHPEQAQNMIEEYWNRTKEHAVGLEKDAMKNAIRKRLGLPMPKSERGFGESAPEPKKEEAPPKRKSGALALLKFLGSNTLKLRYESGENVIYRKHWVVLVLDAWIPFFSTFGLLIILIGRLFQLAFDPELFLFSFQNGFTADTWASVYFLSFFPFAIWLIYRVLDWSNDKFEVTNEQIIDIDRKPLGSESRNAAQLESILGTNYERHGLLGNIFNFGTVYITVGGSKLAFEDVMDPATVQSDIDRRRMARSAQQKEAKIAGERDRMAEWLATYHKSAKDFYNEEGINQVKPNEDNHDEEEYDDEEYDDNEDDEDDFE
ncbi:MAG TPA: cyclic nucleotide-binding domain-containing protein [Anaerolineales bacterium]|nr:cyclic nucleotide-binding domain-containing protein [Anaerolineales bacterium]